MKLIDYIESYDATLQSHKPPKCLSFHLLLKNYRTPSGILIPTTYDTSYLSYMNPVIIVIEGRIHVNAAVMTKRAVAGQNSPSSHARGWVGSAQPEVQ